MANTEQIKALIRSHAEGDDTRFYAITMQVAAQAARSGHGKFATELRSANDLAFHARPKIGLNPTTNLPIVRVLGQTNLLRESRKRHQGQEHSEIPYGGIR